MSDVVQGLVQKISSKKAGRGTVYNVCVNCNDSGEDEWFGHGFDKPTFFEGDEISFDIENNGDYVNIVVSTVEIIAEGDGGNSNNNSRGNSRGGGGRGNSGGRGSAGNSRSGSGNSRNSSGRQSQSRSGGGSRSGGNSSRSSGRSGGGNSGGRGQRGGNSGGNVNQKEKYWEDKAKSDKEKDIRITKMACQNTAIDFVRLALEQGAVKLPSKQADKLDALGALVDEEAERLFDVLQGGEGSTGGYEDGGYEDDGHDGEDIPE